jgi:trehalose 6-phosphate synthase/phosphatase
VDKLGRTSGILLKLRAFKLFLSQYEQYHDRIVLVLCIMSRGAQKTTPEHFAISEQAKELAKSINDEFGFHVEIFDKLDHPSDKSSLLCVSDILLETSLKDGLNMVPFEYLAARDTWLKLEGALDNLSPAIVEEEEDDSFGSNLVRSCSQTGRIVISEFSGSSQVLPGALRVNPWHIDTILAALDEVLTVPLQIARFNFNRDVSYVVSQSQVNWAREFATQITRSSLASSQYMNKVPSGVMLPSAEDSGSSTPRSGIEPTGVGATPVVPATYSAIPKLNIALVTAAYTQSKKRVFFFDNEGTLAPNLSRLYRHYGSIPLAQPTNTDLQSRGCGPSEDVINMLTTLCSDPRNIVMILSGRSQESLSKWFRSVPGIGLAVEHGYHWMHPMITGGVWRNLLENSSPNTLPPSWINLTGEIMNQYVNRTPNTYIEDKGSARVWQFRDAEAEFGLGQAKELHSELEIALRNDPVDITTGKGYVEVKIRGVNKGAAVGQILSALKSEMNIKPDFILSIGDDRSDEYMFGKLLEQPSVFTATVGRKKTVAKYYISDVDSVTGLLAALTGSATAESTTMKKNQSSSNFSSAASAQ